MNTCSGLVWFKSKSRVGALTALKRQIAAGIWGQITVRAEVKSFVPDGDRLHPAVRPPVHTEAMMVRISKTLVAGILALAMAAAVVLPTTPAAAGGWGG